MYDTPYSRLNGIAFFTLYCILYCTLCCKNNCKGTLKWLAISWQEHILPASFECTAHYTIHCTIHFTLHCNLYSIINTTVHCTELYTLHKNNSSWLSWPNLWRTYFFLSLVHVCWTLYCTLYFALYGTAYFSI